MKTINLLIVLVVFLASCQKEQDITPSNAAESSAQGRFANPGNTTNSVACSDLKVNYITVLTQNSPEFIELANSARYLSMDSAIIGGVLDVNYPIILKSYKDHGQVTPFKEIVYRLYEDPVAHNDQPLYRQLLVHCIFNSDSVVKDYAIVIEHFNVLYDIFEYMAYYRPDVPFYGDHTYINISGDTLDTYAFWSDTLKYVSYPNHTIDYYNTPINWTDIVGYTDCLHQAYAPIRVYWIPVSASHPFHAKPLQYHWYAFIDHIYDPTVKYSLIDVEGGIIQYLDN